MLLANSSYFISLKYPNTMMLLIAPRYVYKL